MPLLVVPTMCVGTMCPGGANAPLKFRNIYMCVCVCVDPAFRLMRFPLDGELDFYLKMILFIKKNDLVSPLIFVLFLKG